MSRHGSSPRASGSGAGSITREDAVLCGRPWAEETFRRLDAGVRLTWRAADGERVAAAAVIFEIEGPRAARSSPASAPRSISCNSSRRHRHSGEPLRRGGRRHGLHGPRHPQDPAGPAHCAEVRGALRRRAATTAWAFTTWCSSRRTTSPPPGSISAGDRGGRAASRAARRWRWKSSRLPSSRRRCAPDPTSYCWMTSAWRISLPRYPSTARAAGRWRSKPRAASVWRRFAPSPQTGVDFVSSGGLTKNVRAIDLSMRLDFG